MVNPGDKTITFSIQAQNDDEIRQILLKVYEALKQRGYNPIDQLASYILSEDPTYITNYNNARSLIRRIDRDELMSVLLRNYLGG